MRTTTAAVALAAALVLGTTACSSSNDDGPPGPQPATGDPRTSLEQAVRTYVTALYEPDKDAAWAFVSQRCREHHGRVRFDNDLERRHRFYGTLTMQTFTVDDLAGDVAHISYTVGVGPRDADRVQWRLIDGAWRWDNC